MGLLLTFLGIALGFSFLCSILEAVLLSVTPTFVEQLSESNPKASKKLAALKGAVDRPLAAILILNTIAHTVGAAGVGAQAQTLWGSEALAITSAVLTFLIVVFSEIIPKTIGALYWKRLAPVTASFLPWLIRILWPFVFLSELMTGLMKHGHQEEGVSREEIETLARLGRSQGVVAESESRILANLFRIASMQTADIMTPRTVMVALQCDTLVREAIENREVMTFSRIPIYSDKLDHIEGYILKDDLFLKAAKDELDLPLSALRRSVHMVPETMPVTNLFEELLGRREQFFVVVDEYGGVDGVVTMEDVLETLLGREIVDEADRAEDMREIAREKWEERSKRLSTPPVPMPSKSSSPPPNNEDSSS